MFSFMIVASLMCPSVVVQIPENSTWNDYDQATFDHAQVRCGEIYPESPCLVKFTKLEELRYHATCGGKSDDQ